MKVPHAKNGKTARSKVRRGADTRSGARVRELEAENARLREQLEEMKLIHQNTMEHGTFIENELDDQIRKTTILSLTDPLTGIYNRLKLHQSLNHEMERRKAPETAPSVIMFDIDHFKDVNDSYGHHVGDTILIDLIRLVTSLIRKSDVFARWGGEEFIILTTDMGLQGNGVLAERIRRDVERHSFPMVGSLTCSFGVTQMSTTDSPDDLLRRVDKAMYMAKQSGRNCVKVL